MLYYHYSKAFAGHVVSVVVQQIDIEQFLFSADHRCQTSPLMNAASLQLCAVAFIMDLLMS